MKINSNKILGLLVEDLLLEIVPILNQKEEASHLRVVSQDIDLVSQLLLNQVNDYKTRFVDGVTESKLRQQKIQYYSKAAKTFGRIK